MAAFILGELGRPVQFLDYALEWPEFFFSLDAAERAPFMKYAGPIFEQFIRRAAAKLREREIHPGSRTNCGSRRGSSCLTLNLERVALYLLRPDAGLVVPAPTPTPTWLGDAQRAGLVS